jgi:hypothetical protein
VSVPDESLIAACGLDCGPCEIRRVPFDEAVGQGVVTWYREQGWLEKDEGLEQVLSRGMYCMGCHGQRSLHWSPDCWILQCCVDGKGLQHCSECDVFPCERLQEWAGEKEGYAQALQRLQRMQADRSP